MYDHFSDLGRYVSILDRLMKMYYDRGLSDYEIGWGQQFYVEYIYDHPGATPQEMAQCIRVDKGTLTKTIKKLTEVGYIRAGGRTDQKNTRRFFRGSPGGDFRRGSECNRKHPAPNSRQH